MSRHTINPELLVPVEGEEALAWAVDWSENTEAAYPRAELRERIRAALDTDARIPYVTRRGEHLYNFWRDASHVRGVWRRTTLDSYLSEDPEWEVLVDVDALAREEDEDWVWKGAHVLVPANDRALLRLSRGGADATVVREFSLNSRSFIEGGFTLPEAKSDVSWVDEDTLLVGTDFGEGSLTTSGYPAQVRLWRRGDAIADAEVYATCSPDDVLIGAWSEPLTGRITVTRAMDFYSSRVAVSTDAGLQVLELPEDCESVIHQQFLLIHPRTAVHGVPAGGLGVMLLEDFLAGSRDFMLVFQPTAHTSLRSMAFTENYLVLTVLDDVATAVSLVPLSFSAGVIDLELPAAATASVVATSHLDGDEIWLSVSSPTTPPTLYRWAPAEGAAELRVAKQTPALFDAEGLETRQHWATSADGTEIPYFITGDFSLGARPTLCGGYGGFEVSLTPGYSPVQGLAWLEGGRHYVQPNLRGGGEFGPEWHSQVVKTNRHKVWEDHEAVLRDVVERGYCTPDQLGIRGGSNGGLLTAGALNRYPSAFGASVVQVPLTDMLRYHEWLAGASWMAEYGDPRVDEERRALESWSPLHNVSATVPYPPALVTSSTRDDRVHPAHARLFARALAEAGQPVDYFENTGGGHAGASDNDQVARVESLIYSWLVEKLG
ncbi:prolyl oligopeptidase family serine peptidase [Corynebacterium guangdongense]|uniref:Prolyl oligopeptidase n=1 Tax=Corynebacterium guangdongense TaxID=1783348 RepID=A0ABU2A1H0_9CORY|nr:prolyl oligopeptidase family serine peptidase [Corynebacterium guangdongense]MDR7330860.1 prolyl oligopeptidase [Corynebacterium guangdongense]WJZ16875.1 Prolyl endopeptidase precursor [Corynebacterium guangdongense]